MTLLDHLPGWAISIAPDDVMLTYGLAGVCIRRAEWDAHHDDPSGVTLAAELHESAIGLRHPVTYRVTLGRGQWAMAVGYWPVLR